MTVSVSWTGIAGSDEQRFADIWMIPSGGQLVAEDENVEEGDGDFDEDDFDDDFDDDFEEEDDFEDDLPDEMSDDDLDHV